METAESYFNRLNTAETRKRLIAHQAIVRSKVISNKGLKALVNHGRWVVMCPHCASTEFLFEDNLFFCSECQNGLNDGMLYQVVVPKERTEIEVLLASRPIDNRNWFPSESIKDLETENKNYKVEVR